MDQSRLRRNIGIVLDILKEVVYSHNNDEGSKTLSPRNRKGNNMKITELQNIIANLVTAVPVSIDLISEGRLLKTGNPYPNAQKHVTISGLVGSSYENAVNNPT